MLSPSVQQPSLSNLEVEDCEAIFDPVDGVEYDNREMAVVHSGGEGVMGSNNIAAASRLPLADDDNDDDDDDGHGLRVIGADYLEKVLTRRVVAVIAAVALTLLLLVLCIAAVRHNNKLSPKPNDSAPLSYLLSASKPRHVSRLRDSEVAFYHHPKNSLKILLVSDPKAAFAAAAMNVGGIGSQTDPREFQGLAHFLEHMLFYASKTYPMEGSYSKFLTSHGGYDNAYTAEANTNYYFQVDASALNETLSRFAHFFIDPLLSENGVSREVNAVNAEHQKNIKNDGWREWELLLRQARSGSRLHHFGTGSLSTLQKPGLHRGLVDFYNSYYTRETTQGGNMTLCVTGPQSIQELQNMATSAFEEVRAPWTNETLVTSSSPPQPIILPFDADIDLPLRLHVAPETPSTRTVSIFFVLSSVKDWLRSSYPSQVANFLTFIHREKHVGTKSLWHCLTSESQRFYLRDAIRFELFDATNFDAVFRVSIPLTAEGEKHVDDVISTYYNDFLAPLTHSVKSHDATLFDLWSNFQKLAEVRFDFVTGGVETTTPSDLASELASRMYYVPTIDKNILQCPRYWNFANLFPALELVLSAVSEENAVEMIWSSAFNASEMMYTDPYYGTKYNKTKLAKPNKKKVSICSAAPLQRRGENTLLPHNFEVYKHDMTNDDGAAVITNNNKPTTTTTWWSSRPERASNKLFPYNSTFVDSPTTVIKCRLEYNAPSYSLRDELYSDLFDLMVEVDTNSLDELTTEVNAEFGVELTRTRANKSFLYFTASGFTSSLPLIWTRLTSNYMLPTTAMKIIDEKLSDKELDVLFSKKITALESKKSDALYLSVVRYFLPLVLEKDAVPLDVQLEEITKMNREEPIVRKANFRKSIVEGSGNNNNNASAAKCLFYGNLNNSFISTILSPIVNSTNTNNDNKNKATTPAKVLSFPTFSSSSSSSKKAVELQLHLRPLLLSDPNSATLVRYELGTVYSEKLHAEALILEKVLDNLCFDELRTKQQLGYVVFCRARVDKRRRRQVSFLVLVQSGVYNASLLLQRIDDFVENSLTVGKVFPTSSSSSSWFDNAVRGVLADLTEPVSSLNSEATSTLWTEIDENGEGNDHELAFDHKIKLRDALATNCTADSVRDLFVGRMKRKSQNNKNTNYKKLSLLIDHRTLKETKTQKTESESIDIEFYDLRNVTDFVKWKSDSPFYN
eukprot:PhM_4_TR17009/c0_g1_i1/m.55612/K01408/IDE, ide; insulysin